MAAVRLQVAIDLVELDVGEVVRLDRMGEARVHLLDLAEDRLRLLALGADRRVGRRRAGADEQERRERRDGEAEERSLSPFQVRHAASRWPDERLADGGVTGHKSGSLAASEDVCTPNRRENVCKQPRFRVIRSPARARACAISRAVRGGSDPRSDGGRLLRRPGARAPSSRLSRPRSARPSSISSPPRRRSHAPGQPPTGSSGDARRWRWPATGRAPRRRSSGARWRRPA